MFDEISRKCCKATNVVDSGILQLSRGTDAMDRRIELPIMIATLNILRKHGNRLGSYLFRIFEVLGTIDPERLFVSVVFQNMIGIEYQSHYDDIYPDIKNSLGDNVKLYGKDTVINSVSKISNSMAAWKLVLFQAWLLRNECPELVETKEKKVPVGKILDVDVTTIRSSSSRKEGAEIGFNKKRKGKPCFQFSASFVGRVFADGKLFPGHVNPKIFFRKAVKRAISLGYGIEIVRADSAYLSAENLLLLEKLSLGYAIGAPSTFSAVKKEKDRFRKLARKKSSEIVSVAKGVSVLDSGRVALSGGIETRLLVVRRIGRKKNRTTGKWKIRTYYYAIATNLTLSPRKLYAFYHGRQCVEAGFRELKQHWNLERLPFKSLKSNEFWIIFKIVSMTLFKIFQVRNLPKSCRTLLRKTFIRSVLRKGLRVGRDGKVEVVPKARTTWILRRLLAKTERMKLAINS